MADSMYAYPIFAKDMKDVPEWMKAARNWRDAVHVDKLRKLQLHVKMCCSKCEEKVIEGIQEVPGVFSVRAERFASKVVVVEAPQRLNDHAVLKKARKIDKKAKFVELDEKEKPKTEKQKEEKQAKDEKAKDEKAKAKAKEEYEKKLKEHTAEMAKLHVWNPPPLMPLLYGRPGPYYIPQPEAYYPGDFFNSARRQFEEEEELKKKKLKEEEEKKKKKEKEVEEKKKMQEAAAAALPWVWTPSGWQRNGPYYAPQPYPYRPEELQAHRLSEWYAPRHFYPPTPFQPARDEFHQPYYYY